MLLALAIALMPHYMVRQTLSLMRERRSNSPQHRKSTT
ncbi:hypothetical protein EV192_106260 [Actinocrispum wychmicini]|uniref:Uncharacterized protein n=1 Tax=Actinocrispum wychmicini TaxID=1213861 RepID=A0A4R2JRH3_9PSEU|nr:hypothetical protein EV192_106260 [Actinocrispum wychmicini]